MKKEIQSVASVKSTFWEKAFTIIFVYLVSVNVSGQDIVNTLGPGGKFIAKEESINSMVLGDHNNISIGSNK